MVYQLCAIYIMYMYRVNIFHFISESKSYQKPSSYKLTYKDVRISKSEFTQKSDTAQDAEFGKGKCRICLGYLHLQWFGQVQKSVPFD